MEDGLHHFRIASAAAQIATNGKTHLFLCGLRILHEQSDSGHNQAGCAETTLHPTILDKGRLHGVQRSPVANPLRGNLRSRVP